MDKLSKSGDRRSGIVGFRCFKHVAQILPQRCGFGCFLGSEIEEKECGCSGNHSSCC